MIGGVNLAADLETQRKAIQNYYRTLFESGEYWRRNKYIYHIILSGVRNTGIVKENMEQ